jgi:hypothetical protein
MAIGIVSDSDLFAELNSLNPKRDTSTPAPIPVPELIEEPLTNDNKKQESALPDHLSPAPQLIDRSYPPRTHLVTTVAAPQHRSTQPGGTLIQDIPVRGRKKGDVNVPDSLRKLIAETALMDGREAALQLAADFGISASSVSAYTNGATSTKTYDEPKSEMISHINGVKARAIKRASKTLNGALKAISQDKLDNTDAKDLAGIARDMTVVIKNLTPDNGSDNPDGPKAPQFVVFAPQFRDERSFESITINE